MKTLIRGISLLLALLTLLSLVACGGGDDMNDTSNTPTTPGSTTPNDDPMRPGDSTPDNSTPGDDPLLPGDSTPSDTSPSGTDGSTTPGGSGNGDTMLDNAAELLEQAIHLFREEATVRLGKITSEATLDGQTSTSTTSFRFARKDADFMAHTDSGSDTSEIIVVDNTAYVRIGDILKEKTTFTQEQYNTVLYSATLSVLDALDIASFSSINGVRQADGTAHIVCRGIAVRESDKLEAVLNTVNMDMSEVADQLECIFVLDGEGKIISERCEIGTTVGPALRTTDSHTVDLRLLVEASCEYPEEMTIFAPTDADTYTTVDFRELFPE